MHRPGIYTKQASQQVKFFIFDASASLLFLAILIFQNLISIALFIVVNTVLSMMISRGFSLGMSLRKFSVMVTGRKKYKFLPQLRKDHLFD